MPEPLLSKVFVRQMPETLTYPGNGRQDACTVDLSNILESLDTRTIIYPVPQYTDVLTIEVSRLQKTDAGTTVKSSSEQTMVENLGYPVSQLTDSRTKELQRLTIVTKTELKTLLTIAALRLVALTLERTGED